MAGDLGVAVPSPLTVPDDEPGLVVRIQRGDRAAFDALARRYARRAFVVAYRILRHTQDAEDLVQDAFIAALCGIGSFDSARPFGPWFFRIVVNRALNAANARSARDRYATLFDGRNDHATDADVDPAERSEIRTRFQRAIDTLPRRQRRIVELSDVHGHSSAEIGEMLDLPRGTVRWHLHRARKTLRVTLAPLRAVPWTGRAAADNTSEWFACRPR